ncbi:MAG TPA: hypothetical protein VJL80_06470 [Aeromicrobium sp.]|nr:hypothetical protein [Aeromicrobium sp.]HKY57663.1 hypothetical protein [Aeromicrobium sp.]
MTAIVFPDVELVVVEYLRAALAARPESFADAKVDIRVPSTVPPRLVWVRRDGGTRQEATREVARVSINIFAGTEADATDLARLVRALLWAAPDGDPILRVNDFSGPVAIPDESQRKRRFFGVEVHIRGENLPADLTA